tara:strand:- start:373 stop:738 length:366 start_codon:yes stop_codon:yes gene_type:complete
MRQFRDSKYWVSEVGEVSRYEPKRRHKNGKYKGYFYYKDYPEKWVPMKPSLNNNGYLTFNLPQPYGNIALHQLITEVYLGKCPNGYEVDHIDNNKLNNHPSNLQYLTKAENIRKGQVFKNL